MADQEERLTERLMVQLSPRDLRALQAIADDMERPLAWVARRGIRLYISQILEAEATLARGDDIVDGMRREAAGGREAENQDN
jgi:predicted transcriptional regulator